MQVHSPMAPMRRTLRAAQFAAAALALTACAAAPPVPAELVLTRPVVLLGEVHDNAVQHDLRLRAVEDWIARGARPAVLMEQFDREQQAAIDRLRAQRPTPDADALIAAAAPARGAARGRRGGPDGVRGGASGARGAGPHASRRAAGRGPR